MNSGGITPLLSTLYVMFLARPTSRGVPFSVGDSADISLSPAALDAVEKVPRVSRSSSAKSFGSGAFTDRGASDGRRPSDRAAASSGARRDVTAGDETTSETAIARATGSTGVYSAIGWAIL